MHTLKETERIERLITLLVAASGISKETKLLVLEEFQGAIVGRYGLQVSEARDDVTGGVAGLTCRNWIKLWQ